MLSATHIRKCTLAVSLVPFSFVGSTLRNALEATDLMGIEELSLMFLEGHGRMGLVEIGVAPREDGQ